MGEQKRDNIHLDASTKQAEFAAFRRGRDAQLDMPVLVLPAVQVNVRGGMLPEPEANGVRYLKIPLNTF